MTLTVTTAPTELPVTLDEVKAHCRETDASFDAELVGYLRMAVDQLDGPNGLLNRCLITQTIEYKIDKFPGTFGTFRELGIFRSAFNLPLSPLVSVSSITYLDENGDSQTLGTSIYRALNAGAETKRGRIELAFGETWPTTRLIEQAVTVTYVAGFGDRNAVPWKYRALVLAWVKEMYDHREPVSSDQMMRTPAFQGAFSQCVFPAVG